MAYSILVINFSTYLVTIYDTLTAWLSFTQYILLWHTSISENMRYLIIVVVSVSSLGCIRRLETDQKLTTSLYVDRPGKNLVWEDIHVCSIKEGVEWPVNHPYTRCVHIGVHITNCVSACMTHCGCPYTVAIFTISVTTNSGSDIMLFMQITPNLCFWFHSWHTHTQLSRKRVMCT